jgi:hypothetical protein
MEAPGAGPHKIFGLEPPLEKSSLDGPSSNRCRSSIMPHDIFCTNESTASRHAFVHDTCHAQVSRPLYCTAIITVLWRVIVRRAVLSLFAYKLRLMYNVYLWGAGKNVPRKNVQRKKRLRPRKKRPCREERAGKNVLNKVRRRKRPRKKRPGVNHSGKTPPETRPAIRWRLYRVGPGPP